MHFYLYVFILSSLDQNNSMETKSVISSKTFAAVLTSCGQVSERKILSEVYVA